MAVNRYSLSPKPIKSIRSIYPKEPVIYKIINLINNKCYVGQTVNFRKRLNKHYRYLSNNTHESKHLQNAFNKYGLNSFCVEIIEIVNINNIVEREIYWIKKLNSADENNGYNLLIDTPSPWYGKRSKEHCRKISEALKGKHHSEETKKKQSEARKGRFKGKNHPFSKAIIQHDKNMNIINKYDSINLASVDTKISRTSINNNLTGRSKSAGGFIWAYNKI
jgi:group I intron endonuclease